MASDSAVAQAAQKLEAVSIGDLKLESYPNCYPELNPVDIYRSRLTTILHGVTGVDKSIIYPALQWTQTLDKGDFAMAAPALRIKGRKPDELAKEWVEKVRWRLVAGSNDLWSDKTCLH